MSRTELIAGTGIRPRSWASRPIGGSSPSRVDEGNRFADRHAAETLTNELRAAFRTLR